MEEIENNKLLNSLKEKRCFFFTGSGISYASKIASVKDVLKHTCNKFIPTFNTDVTCIPPVGDDHIKTRTDYICESQKVQPELFYSVLLDCAGTERVLEMWNCLKQDHFTADYCPQPNTIHFFIVTYSYLANVPVFTMNYDKMLEKACEKLNIPFCVLPYDKDTPSIMPQNQVIICKLHGDLREDVGHEVTRKDIKTTMSDISEKNGKWLRYIESFMKTHDMFICGYSGRDIDYFPFLRDYTKKDGFSNRIFWTVGNPKNNEIDKITYDNASSFSNVNTINGHPSDMKKELITVLSSLDGSRDFASNICKFDGQLSLSGEAKESFLKEIESSIDTCDVSFDTDILWMSLMKATGQNKALGDTIKALLERTYEHTISLTEKERFELLEARLVLAREQADFSVYNQIAKELKKKAKRSRLPDDERRRYLEIARVEHVSSLQMCVPSALKLKVPLFKRRYGLLLLVRLGFAFLNYRFHYNKELYDKNKTLAQECKIRSLAIDCGFAKKCRSPFFKKITIKRLVRLSNEAYGIGNYETLIGTYKYLARLVPKNIYDYDKEVKTFGEIVSDLSALSIINRDDNPDEALKNAKYNDNTLNIVKAIFAKKYKINEGNTDLTITEQDKELLLKSIETITPESLKQTLRIMGEREYLF